MWCNVGSLSTYGKKTLTAVAKHKHAGADGDAKASHKTNIAHNQPMPDSSAMDCIPEDSAVVLGDMPR